MKYAVLGLSLSFLVFCTSVAYPRTQDKVPVQNLPLLSGDETLGLSPPRIKPPGHLIPFSTDDYVGEIDTVGTTWYPLQHHGSCGRMIRVDQSGNIHVVWTKGYEAGSVNRHVYYNLYDSTQGWVWGEVGWWVESTTRGGYTTLGVDTDCSPFPAFHVVTPISPLGKAHTAVATDFMHSYPFQFWEAPYVGNPVLEVIWPKIAVDVQGRLHVVSTENPVSGISGTPMRMYYCRGTYDPIAFNIEYQPNQTLVDWTETIAADIAASRHSDRVASVYTAIRTTLQGDTNQYNNDINLVISEDGVTWDFGRSINVTDFIHPDTSLFPDTLAAMGDTLRAYTDASVFFDHNDNIHVAFTTPYYDAIRGFISQNNSLIWHWSEETGYFSLVADGWFGDVPYACGPWQRFVQRPCICEDETTGDLFITYQLFDTSDFAGTGFYQSEVMISRSTSAGLYWSTGIDVTNTHAPGAEPDSCLSEYSITCNETVEDGHVHILEFVDTDGMQWLNPYGEYTLDYVIYQKVPIDEIPATPLMPVRPMHVDSSGMPPLAVPEQPHAGIIPDQFRLYQNYPNPFNVSTTIRFDVPLSAHVTLKIYNVLGREVLTLVDARLLPGSYRVEFNAAEYASGVYFCRLASSDRSETRKMVLLK